MQLKAKCTFDFDLCKAFVHVTFYKKANPKKAFAFSLAFYLILLFATTAELILFKDPLSVGLLLVGVLLTTYVFFLYFGMPRIQYKSLAKMKDIENTYTFCDDAFKVSSKSDEYNSETQIAYSMLLKVYESSEYFFLYHASYQCFIVKKSSIEGGSVDDLRNKLYSVVKKYNICHY